jgi:DNA-binding NtrC family response regulator
MPAHILLVEDNIVSRRSTSGFLRSHGYQVTPAVTGEAALKLIKEAGGFDVVISDFLMSGTINGLDVLTYQKQVSPGTGMILMTAFGSDEVKNRALSIGAVYLDKPVQLDDLVVRIKNLTAK